MFYGRSTAFLAVELVNSGKSFTLDVVDHWRGSVGQQLLPAGVNPEDLCAAFLGNMRKGGVLDRMTVKSMPSAVAADTYPGGSCDLGCLDASHDEASVSADIKSWLPKVKPGGLLAGHDFDEASDPGVVAAVRSAFGPGGVAVRGKVWSFRVGEAGKP